MHITGIFKNSGITVFRNPFPISEDGSLTVSKSGLSVCGIRPSHTIAHAAAAGFACSLLMVLCYPNPIIVKFVGGPIALAMAIGAARTPTQEQRRTTIEIPWNAVRKISSSGSQVRVLVKGFKPAGWILFQTSADAMQVANEMLELRDASNAALRYPETASPDSER